MSKKNKRNKGGKSATTSTEAQINANRINAQGSTGPTSEEGKAVVSQNATKRNLSTPNFVLLPEEDPVVYEAFFQEELGFLKPDNPEELKYATLIIQDRWRLGRISSMEYDAAVALQPGLARNHEMRLIGRYSRTIQLSMMRNEKKLEQLQDARKNPPLPYKSQQEFNDAVHREVNNRVVAAERQLDDRWENMSKREKAVMDREEAFLTHKDALCRLATGQDPIGKILSDMGFSQNGFVSLSQKLAQDSAQKNGSNGTNSGKI